VKKTTTQDVIHNTADNSSDNFPIIILQTKPTDRDTTQDCSIFTVKNWLKSELRDPDCWWHLCSTPGHRTNWLSTNFISNLNLDCQPTLALH